MEKYAQQKILFRDTKWLLSNTPYCYIGVVTTQQYGPAQCLAQHGRSTVNLYRGRAEKRYSFFLVVRGCKQWRTQEFFEDLRLATLKAVSFYLLHNVSKLNQCRNVSCVTVVCKHFVSYQGYPNYRWDLTLILIMPYVYGAPCKARNFNVVYIWTYVWQR
jgi:hypothetical protein